MAGTLALVGGGEFTEGCTFDAELLRDSGGAEVMVLPAGAAFENPDKQIAVATGWFAELGATVRSVPVLQRPAALDPANVDAVRQARFLYVVGSSPLHLRSVVKGTPLWQAVVDAWNDGAVVAGSAESASALCDPMVDPRGGAFTMGLGLIDGVGVLPHADADIVEHHRRTLELAAGKVVLAAVAERTALIRAPDGSWRTGGAGTVRIFVNGVEKGLDALP